ncbi:MAG: helix-turn-helix domain-containing protein [Candidatus Sumerlaeaceae bacterium]|nr:helix-turn-helix domain-containing protein [Candidatus Sumerlaeaceae bacterium]
MNFDESILLRVTEVAHLLGISRAKAYALVASGELPSIRIGRSVRVPRAALGHWIQRRMGNDEEESDEA